MALYMSRDLALAQSELILVRYGIDNLTDAYSRNVHEQDKPFVSPSMYYKRLLSLERQLTHEIRFLVERPRPVEPDRRIKPAGNWFVRFVNALNPIKYEERPVRNPPRRRPNPIPIPEAGAVSEPNKRQGRQRSN